MRVIRDERRGDACVAGWIRALGADEALQEVDELLALLVDPARGHFPVGWHMHSPDEFPLIAAHDAFARDDALHNFRSGR